MTEVAGSRKMTRQLFEEGQLCSVSLLHSENKYFDGLVYEPIFPSSV